VAGWVRWREPPHFLLNNLLTYALFPIVGGTTFQALIHENQISSDTVQFYVLVYGLFWGALLLNFLMIASYSAYVQRSSFLKKCKIILPVLPSEFMNAALAIGVTLVYVESGLGALAVFACVLLAVESLLTALAASQKRCDALEVRVNQLASLQVGLLSSILRTLDLRDQMTARHSASVAFYSRAVGRKLGYSSHDQELVHIAALLHDIGKFVLPDRILKARVPLTEADWGEIRRHPVIGARLVASLEGYGPVAEIILSHHERVDGLGYPAGLSGSQIPALSQVIAVAESYDAMTTRDSYRAMLSPTEALRELRRSGGRQFELRFVDALAAVVEEQLDVIDADYEQLMDEEAEAAAARAGSSAFRPARRSVRGLLVTS
jgi:putative nucleotidyltransferase with HDIG domain